MDQLNEERLRRLVLANEIRVNRANDKKLIKAGRLDPATVLRDPPKHWEKARIVELLMAMPKIGRDSASKMCRFEHIALERRLNELTSRQRTVLARQIDLRLRRNDAARAVLEGR
jgi:hypothetical protein